MSKNVENQKNSGKKTKEESKQNNKRSDWEAPLLTGEEKNKQSKNQESKASKKNTNNKTKVEQKNYESFADRLPNVKKVRNKRLYRRLILIVSIFMMAILFLIYFVSPLSKLGDILVSGNQNVPIQTIIEQSTLKKGESLWEQFSKREIYEKQIQRQLPRIKTVKILLKSLNSFIIKVEEYKVVAMSSKNNIYYPILENGKVLSEELKTPQSGMPIIKNFEDQEIIKNLMTSYGKLEEEVKQNILEITYTPTKSNSELVNLHMKDTNIVVINISELHVKMPYYKEIEKRMTKPGTIDMEVGIYSKAFETEESSETSTENY